VSGILKILASRGASSIASYWTEYLCLRKGLYRRFKVYVGGYESLADVQTFYNSKTDEYDLPKMIGGKMVVGMEDGSVIGGEPEYYDDDDQIEFDDPNDLELADWLRTKNWLSELDTIRQVIKS
jgi:hypothetical protein